GLGIATASDAFYLPLQGRPAAEVADALATRPLSTHDVEEQSYRWVFSTFLSAYLLGAGARDPRLDDLSREMLGMALMGSDQLLGVGRNLIKPSAADVHEAATYAGQ